MLFKYSTLLVTIAVLGVSAVEPQDHHDKSVGAPLARGRSAQDMVFNQFYTSSEKQDTKNAGPVSEKKVEMDEDENEMDENEADEDENEPDENSPRQKNTKDRGSGGRHTGIAEEDEHPPSSPNNDDIAVQSTKGKESQSLSVPYSPPSSAAPVIATSSSAPPPVAKSANATPAPAASSSSPTVAAANPASTGVSSISLESLSFPAGPSNAASANGKPAAATATGRGANRGLAANRRKNAAPSSYAIPTSFSVVAFVLVAVALF